jgi:ribosomal protein L37E
MGLFSAEEPKSYEIDNKQLICMFCSNKTFHTRTEQLHSPGRTFLNLEWTDRTATCFVCSSCGFIHWFMR